MSADNPDEHNLFQYPPVFDVDDFPEEISASSATSEARADQLVSVGEIGVATLTGEQADATHVLDEHDAHLPRRWLSSSLRRIEKARFRKRQSSEGQRSFRSDLVEIFLFM